MRISDWSSDVCSSDLLTNEADAAPSGPLADAVRRQTTVMRRHVDHYLSRARAAASGQVLGARTEVMPVIEDLRRALARIHADRGLALVVAGDAGAAFPGQRQDLEVMLGHLIHKDRESQRSDSSH